MNVLGKLPESTAPAGELDKTDFYKALRTSIIASVAVGIVALLNSLSTADWGEYSYIAVPVLAILLDLARRLAADYSERKTAK